jgi:hypothetical protein
VARLFAYPVLSAAIVAGMVGCGSPSSPVTTTTPTTVEHGAYAHCLNEHGVSEPPGPAVGPAPGPAAPPPGVDQATWASAVEACASLAPGPSAE